MVKLLSTISIILVLVLFPPATLAVISNNAVPGEVTYPIKRFLEDGIYAIASLNSVSKAWFAQARSDRRFKEFSTLIAQGKSTEKTINELVSQTEVAANQLEGITDPVEKEKFAKQLVESIQKYDQGLAQVTQVETKPAPVISTPQPSIEPTKSVPAPTPTLAPKPTNTPIPSPTPTSQPVVSPPSSTGDDQAAEDARKRLKEIEDELKKKSKIKLNIENEKEEQDLTPKKESDKIKKDKSDERDSHPRAGDDESSRQQRNSSNKK